MQEKEEIMVSVLCLAYNHEKSIRQAFEGMLTQDVDFPIEILINDDASTDNTAAIITEYYKKYPEIIRPVFQETNQYHNCNLIKEYLRPMARGRYIAVCETDDYWTDKQKLSKQVRFMETHPEYSMCFHAVEQVESDGTRKTIFPLKEAGDVPPELIIKRGGMFCPSPSLLFRRDVLEIWPEFRDQAKVFDYPTQVLAACLGKVYYMSDVMAAYRFESEGSWTSSHDREPDWEHLKNKKLWLKSFDKYTNGRFHKAINSHFAWYGISQHMHFMRNDTAREAKESIEKLKGCEKAKYLAVYTALQIGGKPAVKAAKGFKGFLKDRGLY